jgi:hypothetical protein
MKKQWIHRNNKTAERNFGSKEIDLIAQTLTDLGFQVFIEPVIHNTKFQTSNKIRNPDIEARYGKMKLFLESDGKVHGTLEFPSKSTIRRNQDFQNIKQDCIMINHESLKELKKILKLSIPIEDVIKLVSAYMVLERYGWHISKLAV